MKFALSASRPNLCVIGTDHVYVNCSQDSDEITGEELGFEPLLYIL